jgi:hypothetical protein
LRASYATQNESLEKKRQSFYLFKQAVNIILQRIVSIPRLATTQLIVVEATLRGRGDRKRNKSKR